MICYEAASAAKATATKKLNNINFSPPTRSLYNYVHHICQVTSTIPIANFSLSLRIHLNQSNQPYPPLSLNNPTYTGPGEVPGRVGGQGDEETARSLGIVEEHLQVPGLPGVIHPGSTPGCRRPQQG